MTGSLPGPLCKLAWKVVAPGLIAIIWVFTLVDYTPPQYAEYSYPASVQALGWALTSLSLAALPLVAVRSLYRLADFQNKRLRVDLN